MVFCALLMTLSGALLVYLAHPQQRLGRATFPFAVRIAGCAALFAGLLLWCAASGVGAGMASALTTVMFVWVALPYVAWWRAGTASATQAHQR
jgi:hypothetical protein